LIFGVPGSPKEVAYSAIGSFSTSKISLFPRRNTDLKYEINDFEISEIEKKKIN